MGRSPAPKRWGTTVTLRWRAVTALGRDVRNAASLPATDRRTWVDFAEDGDLPAYGARSRPLIRAPVARVGGQQSERGGIPATSADTAAI